MLSPCGRETKPSWYFCLTRWAPEHKVELIHPKETWAATTAPVFTKRGLAASDLWTKKVKCFWCAPAPMFLSTAHFCYGSPADLGVVVGWFPLTAEFLNPSRAESPQICTRHRVYREPWPPWWWRVGGWRGDVSMPADGEPVSRWGFEICRGSWRWLGVQGCSDVRAWLRWKTSGCLGRKPACLGALPVSRFPPEFCSFIFLSCNHF